MVSYQFGFRDRDSAEDHSKEFEGGRTEPVFRISHSIKPSRTEYATFQREIVALLEPSTTDGASQTDAFNKSCITRRFCASRPQTQLTP